MVRRRVELPATGDVPPETGITEPPCEAQKFVHPVLKLDPAWDAARDNPEFQALLKSD